MSNHRPSRRKIFILIACVVAIAAVAMSLIIAKSTPSKSRSTPHAVASRSETTVPTTKSMPAPRLDPRRHNCARAPGVCGYPDAASTGIEKGVTLRRSGCVEVHHDGQVIENLTINGCTVDVSARNVTIRNVKIVIDAPETWAIVIRPGGSATVDHVDISGVDMANHSVEYGVLSFSTRRVTITNGNFYNCADCIQGEYITATDNYIHDVGGPTDAHVDGIQCDGNAGCHLTALHNTVVAAAIAIALYGDFGTPVDSLISNNLVSGGSYTLYAGTEKSTNIRIINNRISRLIHPHGGLYGPLAYYFPNPGNTFIGNIWDETGTPVVR